MSRRAPFRVDEGLTSAFEALADPSQAPIDCSLASLNGRRPFRAVVVGGGTGAPVSIRSLLALGVQTSAVVAMADDGGSTGLLREAADITPPGDIRKCIAAFADDPYDPLARAFKYRFDIAGGHALGNLMLAALEDACGSFPEAVSICERLVGAQGHVYPSTLDHVRLEAVTRDGKPIEGQALACHSTTALHEVRLCSDSGSISAYRKATEAIADADLVVFGPGSLFTSIIPNLLVPGIVEAVACSDATTLFVCSVADVQGETWGLSSSEHVRALLDHGLDGLLDYVLVSSGLQGRPPFADDASASLGSAERERERVRPVRVDAREIEAIQSMGPMVVERPLADFEHPTWHSPSALRDALLHVIRLSDARRAMLR